MARESHDPLGYTSELPTSLLQGVTEPLPHNLLAAHHKSFQANMNDASTVVVGLAVVGARNRLKVESLVYLLAIIVHIPGNGIVDFLCRLL